MNNSDKEFREYWGYPSGVKALEYEREVKKVWDKLYPYKERCEELQKDLNNIEPSWKDAVIRTKEQDEQIQTLEALLLEAFGPRCDHIYSDSWGMSGAINSETGICGKCGKHRKDFFENKPEIKKLRGKE